MTYGEMRREHFFSHDADFLTPTLREDYRPRGMEPRRKSYASGGYDPIAVKVFRNLQQGRLLLEYDDARPGNF